MKRTGRFTGFAMALTLAALVSGCRVDEHKNGDGDNVKIETPFGGMEVKTNDEVTLDSVGLPAYPGAELVKKDKDNGAADVNMSFGSFQLKVKAISYHTGDSPEKVEAFYRTGMKQYGDVIKCIRDRAVGSPSQTAEGLTCDNNKQNHVSVSDKPSKLELKAGSQQHQHIVSIDPDGSGTKIGLISIELPGKLTGDGDARQ